MKAVCAMALGLVWPCTILCQSLEPLNKELPSWLGFSGEYRNRVEAFRGRNFQPGNDDTYSLNRARLNIHLQPSRWFQVNAQAQDVRVFGNDRIGNVPPYQNSLDLRLAWAEIGSGDSGPIALRIGRQEINIGDERLLGSSNWSNAARSFDAVRLILHAGKTSVHAFASSVVVQVEDSFDHHTQGDNLHGAYAQSDFRGVHIEPYVLWRISPRVRAESGAFGKLDDKTFGVRLTGKFGSSADYGIEIAGQKGSWGADEAGAWAGHWQFTRKLASDKRVPRLRLEYDYATGDKDPHDAKHGTFELIYPTPHDKLGLADQVGWKNIHHLGATAEWLPTKSLTLQTKFHDWWLASTTDGVYNSGGTLIVRDMTGRSGRHVGEEADFQALMNVNKNVRLGGGVGHIFPGGFLQKTTPGAGYTFPYVMLTWYF